MKFNKKTVMVLSFCLGLVMFVSTAFADIVSKTGYEQMKDSIKLTAESFSENLDSFTLQTAITIKDNDKVLTATTNTEKYDNKNWVSESTSEEELTNSVKNTNYSYRDKEGSIWKNSYNHTYYVNKYPIQANEKLFRNPIKDDEFSDIEKIIDAVVGNLKDYVVVNENSDGSKEFSGSLSEGQIPALVNAVSSFVFKKALGQDYHMNGDQIAIPKMTNDLYIKDMKGRMNANKDGIVENFFASGILCGKDKDGVIHDLTVEILMKVLDINSTKIEKPSLEGKKVEKQDNGMNDDGSFISEKLVGKYSNNIVIEKDGKYVKIGERIIEITSAADKHIKGRYYEEYKNEYADYGKDKLDFTFDALSAGYRDAKFMYTNSSGVEQTGHISFDMNGSKFYLSLADKMMLQNGIQNDPSFSRVFDE